MPELVTIPISFFDVAIDYEKPEIRLLGDRVPLVEAIFEALSSYKPSLDDVEVLASGKLSEQGILFKLPQKNISLFVGAIICRFSRNAVSWNSAEETIAILDAAVSTLTNLMGVTLGAKRTAVGMHVQPKTLSFRDILQPFVPAKFATLQPTQISTMANITKWENRAVTIDGSGSVANGLFVKLEREFPVTASYEEMANQLRTDQTELFAILGIEDVAS